MPDDAVTLQLSKAQALVLFDFLARAKPGGPWIAEDAAEKRVLWNIEAMLEKTLVEPLSADYEVLLERARSRVRDPD